MQICKFVRDNAAKRAAISVSPLLAGTSADAMLNDKYSNVCRSQGTSMTITLLWPTVEAINAVHEVWSNLSPSATKRIVGSSGVNRVGDVIDTGLMLACPWPTRDLGGLWTPATSASAYAYGGGTHARAWLADLNVRRLDIDLFDPANLQGYIEVAKLFVGRAWSPSLNSDYGSTLTPVSGNAPFRDSSGARRRVTGTKSRRISIPLTHMSEADRAMITDIVVADEPFLFSQYPNDSQPGRERDFQGYVCVANAAALRRANYAESGTQLELETM